MHPESKMKDVYTVAKVGGKDRWIRLGIGFVNGDGSITIKLDALPVNGVLSVRDYKSPSPALAPTPEEG